MDVEPNLVVIYSSGAPGRIAIAKSLLDEAGIKYVVLNDLIQDLGGWGRMFIGYNYIFGPVVFMARPEDAVCAQELLADLHPIESPMPSRFIRRLVILFLLVALAELTYVLWDVLSMVFR